MLYFFVFVPSIIQHPHRGTALFYPYASVSHTPTRPPHLGGIHPSVGKYHSRPVFAIVYKSWLDHTCLTSPTTYILCQPLRVYTYSQPVISSNPQQRTSRLLSFYISLFLPLTVLDSPPPLIPPTCTDSSCYHHNNNNCLATIAISSTTAHVHTHTLNHPQDV